MATIFISYRREDSAYVVAILRDRLRQRFGVSSVFLDIDNIPLGVDFRDHIRQALVKCDVVLAVIGDRWEGILGDHHRKIDDAADHLRIELEFALQKNIPVIPVLIDGALMPNANRLPAPLMPLAYRQATEIRPGHDLEQDILVLIQRLHELETSASSVVVSLPLSASAPVVAELRAVYEAGHAGAALTPSFSQTDDAATVLKEPDRTTVVESQVAQVSDEPPERQLLNFVRMIEELVMMVHESMNFHRSTEVRRPLQLLLTELQQLRVAARRQLSDVHAKKSRDLEANIASWRTRLTQAVDGTMQWLRSYRDSNGRRLDLLWRRDSWARWRTFAGAQDWYTSDLCSRLNDQ